MCNEGPNDFTTKIFHFHFSQSKKKKGGEAKIVPCAKRQRDREKGKENNPPQL